MEQTVESKIQEELEIDETKIDEELLRQPSRFFYWSSIWAMAGREAKKAKMRTDEMEAKLCREYKDKMSREDPKLRITEKMLDDYVAEHPDYKETKLLQIQEEYKESMLGIAKDAFRQRAQALVELYRNSRDQGGLERAGFNVMQEELEAKRKQAGRHS